jgi:hypothetical protein
MIGSNTDALFVPPHPNPLPMGAREQCDCNVWVCIVAGFFGVPQNDGWGGCFGDKCGME